MVIIENEHYKSKHLNANKFLTNVRYAKCGFDKCKLSNYKFTNCEFEDCIFTNCDFSNTFLALNKNYDSGKFLRCLFITCNLTSTSFNFPIIDNCEFRNCILQETNFDGSRFSNTKFIGELDSCFFRGYSIYASRNSLFAFSKFDASKVSNNMMNVDFSSSKMIGNSFTNRIDLSKCIFPRGSEYVYMSNLNATITKAIEIINKDWVDGYEKETAIKIIRLVHYNKDKQEQKNNFIDSFVAEEMSNEDEGVSMKVFSLIKSLQ